MLLWLVSVVVVGSIIPKPLLFSLQFAISAHYQATKGVCKPLATSNFPETRCSFLTIAKPLALFVAHSAFISLFVTSEAFAIKPKPRLCPRLISPISPICPNPETRKACIRIPETSALLRFLATSAFVLGSIWSIASISSIRSIASTCDLRSLCTKAKLGGRSHHRGNLASLCAKAELGKPFHLLATFLPFLLSSQLTAFYVRDRLRY